VQILTSYRLESGALPEEEAIACADSVCKLIEEWLNKKGAKNLSSEGGTFDSMTPSAKGTFARRKFASESGVVEQIVLQEPTKSQQLFTTSIFLITEPRNVCVFATLSLKSAEASIAPVSAHPRCPNFIQEILRLRSSWHFGDTLLPSPNVLRMNGRERGLALAANIIDPNRTLPVVVISEIEEEPVWADLPEKLALDLAGLAFVARVDEEASWALTDQLGKTLSCYLGAVRLYWPTTSQSVSAAASRSRVWTASSLLSNDTDGKSATKFRSALRRTVMSVAALTLEPPPSIRRIHAEVSRARIASLKARATEYSEELELARLYAEENEELREQLEEARKDLARQTARADAAEFALEQAKAPSEEAEITEGTEHTTPVSGETRFYKKIHSKPSHDVLVQISDCGHNYWQSANKADKAKKGIERLEHSNDWKRLSHCGKCQGGGVWKVEW